MQIKRTRGQYWSLLSRCMCLRCMLKVASSCSDAICPFKDFFFMYYITTAGAATNRIGYTRELQIFSRIRQSRSLLLFSPIRQWSVTTDTREVLISGRKNASRYRRKSLRTIRRMAINVAAIECGSMDTSWVLIFLFFHGKLYASDKEKGRKKKERCLIFPPWLACTRDIRTKLFLAFFRKWIPFERNIKFLSR